MAAAARDAMADAMAAPGTQHGEGKPKVSDSIYVYPISRCWMMTGRLRRKKPGKVVTEEMTRGITEEVTETQLVQWHINGSTHSDSLEGKSMKQ